MYNFIVSFYKKLNDQFFSKHERSEKARKNILYSLILKILGILVSLVLLPLTINYLNPTQYGIWLTLSSIVGWIGFFDIGLGNGMRNRFAEALARGQFELARIYVSTTYAILSIIIALVLVIFICINQFLRWDQILNTADNMSKELSLVALIVFVFFCFKFVLQLLNTVLTSDQQPSKAALNDFLSSLFSLLLIFILTRTTEGNLLFLALSLGITPIIVLLGSSAYYYNTAYKKFAPSINFVRFYYAKDLFKLGIQFFFLQITFIIVFSTANIVIAQLFGPERVTTYNIAFKYFSIITMAFNIILTPYWTAFTEAYQKGEFSWIKREIKSIKYLWFIFSLLAIIMTIFSNYAYKIWIGDNIKISFSLSILFGIYSIIFNFNSIYITFINGVGKIRLQLYLSFFFTVIYIPGTILLAKCIGLEGIVLSSIVIVSVVSIGSTIQYLKIVNKRDKGIWSM